MALTALKSFWLASRFITFVECGQQSLSKYIDTTFIAKLLAGILRKLSRTGSAQTFFALLSSMNGVLVLSYLFGFAKSWSKIEFLLMTFSASYHWSSVQSFSSTTLKLAWSFCVSRMTSTHRCEWICTWVSLFHYLGEEDLLVPGDRTYDKSPCFNLNVTINWCKAFSNVNDILMTVVLAYQITFPIYPKRDLA